HKGSQALPTPVSGTGSRGAALNSKSLTLWGRSSEAAVPLSADLERAAYPGIRRVCTFVFPTESGKMMANGAKRGGPKPWITAGIMGTLSAILLGMAQFPQAAPQRGPLCKSQAGAKAAAVGDPDTLEVFTIYVEFQDE